MAAVLPSPVALDPSWFFSCQFAANMGLSTGLLMVAWAAFSTSGILMAKGALSGTLRRQSTAPEELGDQQRLLLLPESQEFDDNSDHVSAYEA
ncbi:MAG: hypothetical protein KVP17_003262 [Porospora cf. gigantea B]|nr:MAG: hypothetical protein KVP17_003262 [Porospora cf. gigantea B]